MASVVRVAAAHGCSHADRAGTSRTRNDQPTPARRGASAGRRVRRPSRVGCPVDVAVPRIADRGYWRFGGRSGCNLVATGCRWTSADVGRRWRLRRRPAGRWSSCRRCRTNAHGAFRNGVRVTASAMGQCRVGYCWCVQRDRACSTRTGWYRGVAYARRARTSAVARCFQQRSRTRLPTYQLLFDLSAGITGNEPGSAAGLW